MSVDERENPSPAMTQALLDGDLQVAWDHLIASPDRARACEVFARCVHGQMLVASGGVTSLAIMGHTPWGGRVGHREDFDHTVAEIRVGVVPVGGAHAFSPWAWRVHYCWESVRLGVPGMHSQTPLEAACGLRLCADRARVRQVNMRYDGSEEFMGGPDGVLCADCQQQAWRFEDRWYGPTTDDPSPLPAMIGPDARAAVISALADECARRMAQSWPQAQSQLIGRARAAYLQWLAGQLAMTPDHALRRLIKVKAQRLAIAQQAHQDEGRQGFLATRLGGAQLDELLLVLEDSDRPSLPKELRFALAETFSQRAVRRALLT